MTKRVQILYTDDIATYLAAFSGNPAHRAGGARGLRGGGRRGGGVRGDGPRGPRDRGEGPGQHPRVRPGSTPLAKEGRVRVFGRLNENFKKIDTFW